MADATAPLMRAAQVQENVASLSLLGPRAETEVRSRIGRGPLEQIARASRLDWLPLHLDIGLTETVHDVVGQDAMAKWSLRSIQATTQSPLLMGFVRAGLRLFGTSPGTLLELVPRGFDQIYRNCGSVRMEEVGDYEVQMCGENLPKIMLDSPTYLRGIGDSLRVIFDLTRCSGTVESARRDDQAVWTFRWSE